MHLICRLTLFFVTLLNCLLLNAEDHWNQFRGPSGNGISLATNIPTEFDETNNVRWKTLINDSGWSSPVIWEDEVWITTGSDEKQELRTICLDLETGKIKHNIKVFDMIPRKVDPAYINDSPHLNSPATPTPVGEEEHVFVSFGSQGIACLDRQTGKTLWYRRDLRIYQPVRQGSSPIVDEKRLYVAFDGTDQQFFIALDKKTGKTHWKMDRTPTPIGKKPCENVACLTIKVESPTIIKNRLPLHRSSKLMERGSSLHQEQRPLSPTPPTPARSYGERCTPEGSILLHGQSMRMDLSTFSPVD